MKLILLGPPGAGKGTQAKLLAKKESIPHISTGDILREQMQKDSPLGVKVRQLVKNGELVPDNIVLEVVANRLSAADAHKGFILDGFPRTLKQADGLNEALKTLNTAIDLVIYFNTSADVSIQRLCGRRVCKKCGANFHITNMPPKKEGLCDFCQGELYLRDDDKKDTVQRRLQVYQEQTAALIDYYRKNGKLREVSGDLEADKVNAELQKLFSREKLANPALKNGE
ncbi:MAG: adenylate kinase [Candidatus Omnitrophota bacterium]